MRTPGFTVALIGPDGAGKTTVARRLQRELALPVEYVYMGVNPDSSNYLLPTTRAVHAFRRRRGAKPDTAGPREPHQTDQARPRGLVPRGLRSTRSFARLGNSAARRLHGFILTRLYPRPDLVIYLDAPAEVLLARKGEGTLESLERRRREYFEIGRVLDGFSVVDASRPLDTVTREVAEKIEAFSRERRPAQQREVVT